MQMSYRDKVLKIFSRCRLSLTLCWRSISVWAVSLIMLTLLCILFLKDVTINYPNLFATIVKCAGDMVIILLPYWLLRPKWRWTILLPVWLLPALMIINIAYARFWDDLLPPSALLMVKNIDGNLWHYFIQLLQIHDLIYFIAPLLVTITFLFARPWREVSFSKPIKISGIIISVLMGLTGQLSYLVTSFRSSDTENRQRNYLQFVSNHYGVIGKPRHSRARYYQYKYGFLLYGVQYIYDSWGLLFPQKLSADARAEIRTYLDYYKSFEALPVATDSMNVVYIIVESLNAEVLNRTIGDLRITPTLDSLATLPGTVLIDNVYDQVKYSGSADGHMILMSGLLPPEKTLYCFQYGTVNEFPTLAKALANHHKYTLVADDGTVWNEQQILMNYGLGRVKTSLNLHYSASEYGQDGAMLKEAAAMLDTIRRPFMLSMVTMSMHFPFDADTVWKMPVALKQAKGIDKLEKNYLRVTHWFDHYLGEFLRRLPPNTIVFIASDHAAGTSSKRETTSERGRKPVVYMALHTQRTEHIKRVVGQVNLYPATLQLLGIKPGSYWGLAPSALSPSVDGTMNSYGEVIGTPTAGALDTLRRAFRISDRILLGNYFSSAPF